MYMIRIATSYTVFLNDPTQTVELADTSGKFFKIAKNTQTYNPPALPSVLAERIFRYKWNNN